MAVQGLSSDDVDGLHVVVERILADGPPSARLLIVVDQLEEAFTLAPPEAAAALVRHLAAATRRLDRRVAVVVTLRADFYDRAAALPEMADLLSRTQYVVPPVRGEHIEAVVTGPAAATGTALEAGLVASILTDVAGEPGALPLLQHLLLELWEQRTDRVMTRWTYEELGGVAGALANRAESVHSSFDANERAIARRVLLRCVQPGHDGSDTRRPVPTTEWSGHDDDRAAVEHVVSGLVDARLLTSSHDPVSGVRTVELAHEALIDGWPRLRGWVDEAHGWLLDHRRLTIAAADWDGHDRHEDWLLAGLPLEEAHDLLQPTGGDGTCTCRRSNTTWSRSPWLRANATGRHEPTALPARSARRRAAFAAFGSWPPARPSSQWSLPPRVPWHCGPGRAPTERPHRPRRRLQRHERTPWPSLRPRQRAATSGALGCWLPKPGRPHRTWNRPARCWTCWRWTRGWQSWWMIPTPPVADGRPTPRSCSPAPMTRVRRWRTCDHGPEWSRSCRSRSLPTRSAPPSPRPGRWVTANRPGGLAVHDAMTGELLAEHTGEFFAYTIGIAFHPDSTEALDRPGRWNPTAGDPA